MSSKAREDDETPEELRALASDPRVRVRRAGAPGKGKCVVYWMQRAQRAVDNPALNVAVEVANALELPLVVYLIVIPTYPHANERNVTFMNQGLPDVEEDLAERGIPFVVRRPPKNSLEAFLNEVDAAILISDESHTREPERWRAVLTGRLKIPFWTVDADVLVPSGIFGRRMYALHIFRPKLYADLPRYLKKLPATRPQREWKRPKEFESFPVRQDMTAGWRTLDRSIKRVESFTGGTHAALRRLEDFVRRDLAHYDQRRNHPELDGTSRLSPYLHFGHIGPLTIALAVEKALAAGTITQSARDSFINEVIGWRELAVNFVRYTENYDSFECAEPWAQKTLLEHAGDRREHLYTVEELERAETHDELWNAAQQQMVKFGWMHNYMRMYWAKKILEWSPSPVKAYEVAMDMNDRYFIDGRDPNGYAGVAWAILGKFDRPWFERPIFGTIRYMSGASTGRKFQSKKYISQMAGDVSSGELWDQG